MARNSRFFLICYEYYEMMHYQAENSKVGDRKLHETNRKCKIFSLSKTLLPCIL